MPDDDRYARHYAVPGLGRDGQARLHASTARLAGHDRATHLAGVYLAAGGVGTIYCPEQTPVRPLADSGHVPAGSCPEQTPVRPLEDSAGPAATAGIVVELPARPAWWPAAAGDDEALALWRGAAAAAHWMIDAARG